MTYTILDFLGLLGSLGIFIYGMKIMSEGIQKVAGRGLRKALSGMTANRFMGIFTGFIVTGLIQSSSATTVMVVSFVNAGLLTLTESIGVIMGANIGTTLTAWLVVGLGFSKVKIVAFAMPLIGISFPFLFSRRNNLKNIAEFLMGFGILFIGLDFLKGAVPDIRSNPEILSFLQQYADLGFLSVILFVFIGALITILVQSSSASTAIILVMVGQGWIEFDMAAAMFLGGNLGTTITAILAALVGNVHAKRAALFHVIFNVLGVIWTLLVFYQFLDIVSRLADDILWKLAIFHTLFNIANVTLLVGFVPWFEKLVVKIMTSKGDIDERFQLQHISTNLLATPELSITEANKEVQVMGRLVETMWSNIIILLYKNPRNYALLAEKIEKGEDITDNIELEVAHYLTKVAESDLSATASRKIRSMLRVSNELERIGDIVYQMAKNAERMRKSKINFLEEVKKEMEELFDIVYDFLKFMNANFEREKKDAIVKKIYDFENKINRLRDQIQKKHFERLEQGKYTVQGGIIFLDYVNSAEKVGDHIVNINEAMLGLK